MPVITVCPECSAKMKVSDNAVGKQIKCPKCTQPFTVMTAGGSAPAAAPAPRPAAAPVAPSPVAPTPVALDPLEQLAGLESETEKEPAADEPDDLPRKPKPRRKESADFMSYLTYQSFITPNVGIHVLFVIGAGFYLYLGYEFISQSIDAFKFNSTAAMKGLAWGLGLMVGGPIVVRVICETIVAIFRILETLKEK